MKNFLGALMSLRRLWILVHAIIDFCAVSSAMTMEESGDRLCENFPDKGLADRLLRLSTPPNHLLEVTTVAIFHDYVYLCFLFIYCPIDVFDDMWMLQVPQNVNF